MLHYFAIVTQVLTPSSALAFLSANSPAGVKMCQQFHVENKDDKSDPLICGMEKRGSENRSFLSFSKGNFQHRACPTLRRTENEFGQFCFISSPFPPLSSLQYNNSNYAQTTKHASSNDITDMEKLANLHNNKCYFEPIQSLLTFKLYPLMCVCLSWEFFLLGCAGNDQTSVILPMSSFSATSVRTLAPLKTVV